MKWIFMLMVCKTGWMVCVFLMVLCSCNSPKQTYKKRHKPAPCDCPKFNYVPQNDLSRDVACRLSTGHPSFVVRNS